MSPACAAHLERGQQAFSPVFLLPRLVQTSLDGNANLWQMRGFFAHTPGFNTFDHSPSRCIVDTIGWILVVPSAPHLCGASIHPDVDRRWRVSFSHLPVLPAAAGSGENCSCCSPPRPLPEQHLPHQGNACITLGSAVPFCRSGNPATDEIWLEDVKRTRKRKQAWQVSPASRSRN